MKTFYNVVNAIICCAKEARALITGNPGSLLVSRSDFITWLNIENIWGEVKVWKFARKWKLKSMKLTMWQVVVVLNVYTKFREK